MAGMKTADGWRAQEIRAVEIGVHQLLQGIVTGPIYAVDATDQSASDHARRCLQTAKMTGA
jgi:hypothetical protein